MGASEGDAAPIRGTILGTGYTGGHRVAYLLTAFAAVLLGLAAFDAVFPDSGGWSSVALWAGTGVIFLVTADVSGLGYALARDAPAELGEEGFAAPFFRHADFRTRADGVVLRSRLFRIPLARAAAANRVDWDRLVVRVGVDHQRPYLKLSPLKGAPFRSLLTGVRSSLPDDALGALAMRVGRADGDLHVTDALLTDAGRAAVRECPHSFRSDARFGVCLPSPRDPTVAAGWFVNSAQRDPHLVTASPVERGAHAEGIP